ncbi:hypothetical protein Mal15_56770 [Stieleria maiorica]|uniref:DNA primase/polymerase bifunctional N-terminal domain-containing protein n=1 Tax=Stieleria maiorica TaxID=2795974 RepID=A0A5B9MMG0_9BACT|nr:bifunctional DNA primase/polymerase [Stieleria maiorica]QEG01600.1 hypothetical protein Mal15_56770 [Stieleria maiorica]
MNTELFELMLDFVDNGVSVLPIATDGTKKPFSQLLPVVGGKSSWLPFQSRLPVCAEMRDWTKHKIGFGLVCGRVSRGVEVLDFDELADAVFPRWLGKLPVLIRHGLCVVETPSHGYHVIYRSDRVCRSEKIAMTANDENGHRKTIIESRGEGAYIVAAGSPVETHISGRPYCQVMGLPLPTIPVVSQEERTAMWVAAASFDERQANSVTESVIKRRANQYRAAAGAISELDTSTPWGDFSARANWADILLPHGWTSRDGINWTRPGKRHGTSAKLVKAMDGTTVLTVFSGNAGVLAPVSGDHQTWNPFSAFVALEHGGDRKLAAVAARRMGYGV